MSKRTGKLRDKWRMKEWYNVYTPSYFGGNIIANIPCGDTSQIIGRIIEATLYDLTGDFSQQNIKLYFQIFNVKDSNAETIFKGHEYSRDYLRSLVRRGSTKIDTFVDLTTKDGYRIRASVSIFTLKRIKTSKILIMRKIARDISIEKGKNLTFDQFVQEAVLGKIASDIHNAAKKVAPLRHVGIRKSKLLEQPKESPVELAKEA